MTIIAVDFDRTLQFNEARIEGSKMGPPHEGAKEAMVKLHELGHQLIIHTCRANDGPRAIKVVEDWLKFYEIPFDSIWDGLGKPVASVYVDDLAVRFDGKWFETVKLVLEKLE